VLLEIILWTAKCYCLMRNLNIFWFTLLKLKQPKLPVRFKDGDAVEVIEKQEVASTTQVILFSRWNLAACASTQTIQNFSLEVVFFDKIFKNSLWVPQIPFPSSPLWFLYWFLVSQCSLDHSMFTMCILYTYSKHLFYCICRLDRQNPTSTRQKTEHFHLWNA